MKKILGFVFMFLMAASPLWAAARRGQVTSVSDVDGSFQVRYDDGSVSTVRVNSDTRLFGAASLNQLAVGDVVLVNGDANGGATVNATGVERVVEVPAGATPATAVPPSELATSTATGLSGSAMGAQSVAVVGSAGQAAPLNDTITNNPLNDTLVATNVAPPAPPLAAESPVDNTAGLAREVSPTLVDQETARSSAGIVSTPQNSSPVDNRGAEDRFVSPALARQESARVESANFSTGTAIAGTTASGTASGNTGGASAATQQGGTNS
jgi:hypothetical protein